MSKNAHLTLLGINRQQEGFEPNTYFMSPIEEWGHEAMLNSPAGSKRKKIWKSWYIIENGFVIKTITGPDMNGVSQQFLVDFFHNKIEKDVED